MKLLLLAGSLGIVSTTIGDAAAQIILFGAVFAAIGWMWTRMVLPAARTLRRTHKAVGALEDLGSFMDETRLAVTNAETAARQAAAKADHLDGRLDLLERHVSLFAAEDALKVRQATAKALAPRPEGKP